MYVYSIAVNIDNIARVPPPKGPLSHIDLDPQNQSTPIPAPKSGATVRRHNSGRRHTLTNGVDYSMVSLCYITITIIVYHNYCKFIWKLLFVSTLHVLQVHSLLHKQASKQAN